MEEDPVKDVQRIPAHATINPVQVSMNIYSKTIGKNLKYELYIFNLCIQ